MQQSAPHSWGFICGKSCILNNEIKGVQMKNIISLLTFLSLLLFIGCEDDDAVAAVDCIGLANTYTTSTETFTAGFMDGTATIEECQASMDAMAALVESGCDGFSLQDLELTQAQLDSAKDGSSCALMFP
tara:strand:+ start:159 stop:548 length:390 start_codon:yes stop_codon:yes gene_type:complete